MEKIDALPTIIRKYREEKKITQEELSRMIQKSDKYIGAVECGRVKPPFSVLRDIVCALDMDGNELFYEKPNRERCKVADIYLRKMDDTTQKLAIEILQTMANSECNKKPLK